MSVALKRSIKRNQRTKKMSKKHKLKTPIQLTSAFFLQALLFNCVFVSNVFAESVPESQDTSSSSPGNVTIDFKDADIQNVLRILSYKSGVNIVAGKDVTGIVTIRL